MSSPGSAVLSLSSVVGDEQLMAAIPADAVKKIEDELNRREEEIKAERIKVEKDNVVKGKVQGQELMIMSAQQTIYVL
jgi:hypothetical protein